MKSKAKNKNVVETKVSAPVMLKSSELLVKDAAYDTLYGNCEKNPTVLWVLRKDLPKSNTQPGTNMIVFWADILGEWLELRVKDDYKLTSDSAAILSKMRVKPTDRNAIEPTKLKAKFRRKLNKGNKAEREAAKREGREPNLAKRVVTANVDPITNIRMGTRKHEMAVTLLSSKDAKVVRKSMETLIKKFIAEKPNATYNKIGLEKYTNQLIRWTATDGNVKKEVFTEILSALGL